jgi:putative ABC transport system substrate-binding protein
LQEISRKIISSSPESMRRVGVLTNLTHNDPEGRARDDAFVQGLKELGWIESGNLRIIRRWTEGDPERSRQYAAELVGLGLDAILTTGSAGVAGNPYHTDRVHYRSRSCRRWVH